ncbi:MAG: 50S ribosomal protein L15 [Simkaniaceae bacterium]|nr:50S ribosomal protein L15 [Simkaniaceae bacterium]MCF7851877.1 50S ribosomal protein L15 [Simkaniaceae bacterium]
MSVLSNLKNTHRPRASRKRVGRGIGSNWGKTSGRGNKGAKSRAGYKRRLGNEGGQLPLYRKLPHRGFSNAQFKKEVIAINFSRISHDYEDGEVVNRDSLIAKRIIPRNTTAQIKILANGNLDKKVEVHVNALSKKAEEELQKLSLKYSIVG